jgi:hypothetical protein
MAVFVLAKVVFHNDRQWLLFRFGWFPVNKSIKLCTSSLLIKNGKSFILLLKTYYLSLI